MIKIVIANQKGGVGKTTLASHIYWYLQKRGKRVIGLDMDYQDNFIGSISKEKLVLNGTESNIDFKKIIGFRFDSRGDSFAESKKNLLAILSKIKEDHNGSGSYVVIDTPPTLGENMILALSIADIIVTPIQVTRFSIEGLAKLQKTIAACKTEFNDKLMNAGLVLTKVNTRSIQAKEDFNAFVEHLGEKHILGKITNSPSIFTYSENQAVSVWDIKRRSDAKKSGDELNLIISKILKKAKILNKNEEL